MSVQDWLRRDELQQFETPGSATLDHLRILPVEVAGLGGRGKLTVKVKLLMDKRDSLEESQKLRKPGEIYFDLIFSLLGSIYLFQVVTVLACSGQLIGKVVQVIL